jgi:polyhydroxyalkanoate synthesis repressor PhaR
MADSTEPVKIKKYANRRLYDTDSSRYVVLADLARMVRNGIEFEVVDVSSGDDLTRTVLTQIIVEEEANGAQLLPVRFLRHLIRLYGDHAEALLPQYLDHSMDTFARHGEWLRRLAKEASGSERPLTVLEGIMRENLALFERAAESWTQSNAQSEASSPITPISKTEALDALEGELEELQRKFEVLRGRL